MEASMEAKPDLLLIEGTRVDEPCSKTEEDVEEEICSLSKNTKGLAVCNWTLRDTDRMLSFLNVAKRMGKKLAISLRQAYLLNELSKCSDALAPDLNDEAIEFYANRKSWGLIGSACDKRLRNQDYDNWERPYLDKAICYKDIKEHQEKYLMFCSNFDLKELIDIKPVDGSIYIKSVCEPFDIEMEIDWAHVKNWLNHFGLNIKPTHVSGHASADQLKQFIKTVNPKLTIPIHTEKPKLFEQLGKTHLLGKQGDNFKLI